MINQAKLRLYKFLLDMGRIEINVVPEPYKNEIKTETSTL